MKKYSMWVVVLSLLILSGCAQKATPIETAQDMTGSLLGEKVSKYTYSRKMEKPAEEEITNIESMQNGYTQGWKKIIGEEDMGPSLESYKSCKEIKIVDNNGELKKTVSLQQLQKGNIEITGQYNGPGLGIALTDPQTNFLNTHGWVVIKPGDERTMRSSDVGILEQEERGQYYQKIGGINVSYRRYPYNTVFVTTDMLLHFYHKIFSNALRYYEETTARTTMKNLAENMFNKFLNLYTQHQNDELKSYYGLATAYWAIPYALFIPQEEVQTAINNKLTDENENMFGGPGDITKEEIDTLINNRLASIKNKIPKEYQEATQEAMKKILSATESRANDPLLAVMGSTSSPIEIQQDYTQFTPRGHYTDSSLLRTYFLGMKWFMREKFYFNTPTLAKTALVMINNIKNQDLADFKLLYTFIQKLIGQDDDVNITDIQKYLAEKGRTTDNDIISKLTQADQNELNTLRPQKIISTHYQTPNAGDTNEAEAKDETAGFVFFGEKFTIDSYIFDKMTAGSAEIESVYKPSLQTTFIVPEILINTGIMRSVVDLRMQQAESKYGISKNQIAGYNKAKSEVLNETKTFDFSVSTYHEWLNGLGRLFALTDPNLPYFMQDPLYKYKDLNAFQGSYTELKHDTILYVKQAYAEMGGGGGDECMIQVAPPTLPVPKGYVEPNVDLIDALLKLTDETKVFFGEDQSFLEFTKFLFFIKDIAVKQTQNETIDDDTFEKLRLYYSDLLNFLYPKKVIAGDNDFISALIADIFTSENNGPLYIATGKPYLLITKVKDSNGARAVVGPVYSTYEFYDSDEPTNKEGGRYTDDDRQKGYDTLNHDVIYTIPMKKLLEY